MNVVFYTLVKYFWVLCFIAAVFNYMTHWDVEHIWRMGVCLVMIIVFAVVESHHKDNELLVKK